MHKTDRVGGGRRRDVVAARAACGIEDMHMVGTPAAEDVIIYEEADEKFWVGVGLTRSERYLLISADSKLTSEAWLLDAAQPQGEFTVVMPRRPGVEYGVEHQVRREVRLLLVLLDR